MFFRILKKDLKNRRGINVILFLFMLLATVFVASSVNNIIVVSNATNYCLSKGKVGDKYICAYDNVPGQDIGEWLSQSSLVKDYSVNKTVVLAKDNIVSFAGKDGSLFDLSNTILLQTQWDKNMLIFNEDGSLVHMNDGEVGMTQAALDNNNLKIGDVLELKFGDLRKTLKITTVVKDPAYGGDFIGMRRYILSDSDFKDIENQKCFSQKNYNIETDDINALTKEINRQNFDMILLSLDKDTFALSYSMPMITASILIIVGVCLILIAFLILRFTITYTLQEDYKEIGIMKAIGIRNLTIKKIYLVKYLAMILVAAALGCVISVPVSNMMVRSVSSKIMMESAESNFAVNIICSLVVAAVVMLLCYLCTNKLRKFSAIEAIRSGQTGERYAKHSKLSLHKSGRIKPVLFMAVNDILSNVKRYIVLLLTFAIGTAIIILPMNVLTTFNSDEMIRNFSIDLNADFLIENDAEDVNNSDAIPNKKMYVDRIDKIKENLKSKGYDTDISTLEQVSFTFYMDDENDSYQMVAFLPINTDTGYLKLTAGSLPDDADEILMSVKQMEKMNAKIGDTVHYKLDGEVKNAIISGSYSSYMNTGYSVIFSENAKLENARSSGAYIYQCNLKNKKFDDQVMNSLKADFPNYKFMNVSECMSIWLGDTASQMNSLKILLVGFITSINVLITVLMMKIFISGEKSQIAMMRSIGYTVSSVRAWQTIRIGLVLLLGVLLGIIISIPLNQLALSLIFAMMGATNIKIQTNILEAYIVYPLTLLFVICLAAYISSGKIKKLDLMEINNPE